jgi:transcriptional regulator with XRE-family HTH domain
MIDENNHRKVVGKRLQGRREREGWSREQVSEMSGLTVDTIRKVEEGAFNVPLDVLQKIADIYGCEIYFLKYKDK